jgi:2,3-diketo-5-methylthio-1-phosphopentane phosphatase
MMDVEFLGKVFQSINHNENGILEDILSIKLDPYAPKFIENIKESGGDFLILSAGTKYYIERLLEHQGIKDVKIISNPGIYENKGIKMIPDVTSPFYSKRYGIAKEMVVEKYKKEYKKVFFAGDSGPDLNAAILADVAYAKGKLIDLLSEKGVPFQPFNNFIDIENHLMKNILFK